MFWGSFQPVRIPDKIPLMILPNTTLFPEAIIPLHIFESRYRRMLSDVLKSHRMFALAMRRPGASSEIPMPVACVGLIQVCVGAPDGKSNLLLLGLKRVQCAGAARYKPYRLERVEQLESTGEEAVGLSRLRDQLVKMVRSRLGQELDQVLQSALPRMMLEAPTPSMGGEVSSMSAKNGIDSLLKLDSVSRLADFVASTLLSNPSHRQIVLESLDLKTRLENLSSFLSIEIEHKK